MAPTYQDEDKINSEMRISELLKGLWPYLKPYKFLALFCLLLIFCYSIAGRVIPNIFGWAIEDLRQGRQDNIVFFALLYLGFEVMRAGLSLAQTYATERLGNAMLFSLREHMMHRILKLPLRYFDKNPTGRIVTRATNDMNSLGEMFNVGVSTLLVNAIELLSIVATMFWISPALTGVTVLSIPFLLYLTVGLSRRLRSLYQEAKKKTARLNAFISESLSGMSVLQIFNRIEHRKKEFDDISKEYRNVQYATVRIFAWLWPVLSLFRMMVISSALLFGALYWKQWGLNIGELVAFILLIQGFFKPLRNIIERYNQFQDSLASGDRVFSILNQKIEPQTGQILAQLKGKIAFTNFSFAYEKGVPPVLDNLNFVIQPGESVAFVGRTGGGKSTIISLIQKLYPYSQGEILLDDLALDSISSHSLRQRIGVVQQSNFIFKGSIASNISLHDPNISREQVVRCAQQAGLASLLKRHNGGLDAKVEENGDNLSVGEKQLISLARVLVYNPEILILDEATANIDTESENLIQTAIEQITKGRTSLIIAHRLSTIQHCDRVFEVTNGKVVEKF